MANFQYTFDIPKSQKTIEFGNPILFLGSCFSDEIGSQALKYGFSSYSNPFGTLFHPFAIGQTILDALTEKSTFGIVQQDDVFFHWGSSGKIHGYSSSDVEILVNETYKTFLNQLQSASHLFITFGTAKGYRLKGTNQIVANCHKQHPTNFEVELSNSETIIQFWEPIIQELKKINPTLHIVFTVSPVRHLKDGIIENNRSKAQLLIATEALSKLENCKYFPSYEIIIDELRDYRFFKNDFAHPNELAINYVWERFSNVFLTENTAKISKQILSVKSALSHKGLFTKSLKLTEHIENSLRKKEALNEVVNGIIW